MTLENKKDVFSRRYFLKILGAAGAIITTAPYLSHGSQNGISSDHRNIMTGFQELDRMTGGLKPGDLTVIAGRPSMGKTALTMNMVQHAAIIEKIPVAVFSLEMSAEQLALRMLCSIGRIGSQRIHTGRLQDRDLRALKRATEILTEAPIHIDDTPAVTALEMRTKCRRFKSEHDCGLVVVDYLQLMRGRSYAENKKHGISGISRSLKAMAEELDVPVVVLSQLSRGLECRTDKRPQLSDLRISREHSTIKSDADVIVFIYRDEIYDRTEDNPSRGLAEVIIGKQRNGSTGTVRLTFLSQYTTFENYTPM